MRWLWSKRRRAQAPLSPAGHSPAPINLPDVLSPAPHVWEPGDPLLRFARDFLLAGGARVRIDEHDVISATLPDGTAIRYTNSPARARGGEDTAFLAPGSPALAAMVEQSALRAQVVALTLEAMSDAMALAEQAALTMGDKRREMSDVGAVGSTRAVNIVRQWESREIELTYLVVARDRHGRYDEWVRVALDEEGWGRPPLTTIVLERARACALDPADTRRVEAALTAARTLLAPALDAQSSFLRQRTAAEYARRLEEARATYRRLKAEDPARAAEFDGALARELVALDEVYAVEVEARLEGICVYTAPRAEVCLAAESGEVYLTVDLARGEALAPPVTHLAARPPARSNSATGTSGTPADALSVDRLAALLPGAWRACAVWLLETAGYILESAPSSERPLTWRGRLASTASASPTNAEHDGTEHTAEPQEYSAVIACAPLLAPGHSLDEETVRAAASARNLDADRGSSAVPRVVLLTTARPTPGAAREAARLGVRLIARDELAALLATMAGAYQRDREEASADARARAQAAVGARKVLLAALKAHETTLARIPTPKTAATRAAISAAAHEVVVGRQSAGRALVAWETLVSDWRAAFGERTERDGRLRIDAEPARFEEIAQRARHLREAMTQALRQVLRGPSEGDLGYGEWRRLVVEELALRCEALCLRVRSIDPAHWQDVTQARDLEAEAAATRAQTGAERAAARAEQLYAQLVARAGLAR